MKGNPKVLAQLKSLLESELSAFDQYFTHARMYADWGLDKLAERIGHEAEEEMQHAQALIDRILFLEDTPDLSKRGALNIGQDVPSMLKSDLDFEYKVADALRAAIKVCEEEQDYQSREILRQLLEDTEEDHMYWLEKQLRLIDKIGLQNYLQSQM